MAAKMPMLPGFSRHFDRRQSYGKRQVFGTDCNGAMMMDVARNDELVRRMRPGSAPPARTSFAAPSRSVPAGAQFGAKPRPSAAASSSGLVRPSSAATTGRRPVRGTGGVAGMSKQPAWIKYDRKVLRFYGYFVEDVEQSSYETQRVRKVVMYYYLADATVHIAEPKVANSGMPQGVLVAKTKAKNPQGGLYAPTKGARGGLSARGCHERAAEVDPAVPRRAQHVNAVVRGMELRAIHPAPEAPASPTSPA